jgi:hypothetical protein
MANLRCNFRTRSYRIPFDSSSLGRVPDRTPPSIVVPCFSEEHAGFRRFPPEVRPSTVFSSVDSFPLAL